MQPSPLPVRTHRALADEATFQDLVAERLRQAPWLVLSALAHALMLLVLWVMLPGEERKPPLAAVAVALEQPKDVVVPPPPPPPVQQPEVDPEVVPIVDRAVATESSDAFDPIADSSDTTPSAFESTQWNQAVGVGGGAAGPYGNRGPGPGGRGGPGGVPQVKAGLAWLAAHQDDDGRWDADGFMKHDDPRTPQCGGPGNPVHDVGVTGLALLAFLGDGNSLRSGPYRDVVRRGALWLRAQQQDDGRFGGAASSDFVYDHAIAAYAMCEAYGLSDYKTLKDCAQQGLAYLETHRNPYGVWRYQPRDNDNDLSVTGWCVMAYESGKFFGLAVNDAALQNAAVFLDQVSDATGLHGYTRAGERSSRKPGDHAVRFPVEKGQALTAVGLFCRFFLGQRPDEKPVMKAAAKLIAAAPPQWDEHGTIDHYYWYYATYALFQMGGPQWRTWQQQLARAVGDHQHRSDAAPNLRGSWDPVGAWGEDGGRVYSTAILTLTMQANYRYTRLIR